MEELIDFACEMRMYDYFRSEDPVGAARFVVSDAVALLWGRMRDHYGFAAFAEQGISPRRVIATAEPLLPELRDAIRDRWGARIANAWGTSEAAITAMGCYESDGMHLSEDNVIVEPVDEHGEAVGIGETSAKLYLTNLINPVLPLIRYEITDEVTVLPAGCSCGSAYTRVLDIQGRLDDAFWYDDVCVHPHVFRTVLGRQREVVEYQVQQTSNGVTVILRCGSRPPDLDEVQQQMVHALARVGMPEASVNLRPVDRIERQASGKLKRFVALARP